MGNKIESIEGIGPAMSAALRKAGVSTVETLLEVACDKKGRAALATRSKINPSRLLTWINMADLFRIRGVASQYAELLIGAGVDTVRELRNRNPKNLTAKINEINLDKNLVRSVPSEKMVTSWIEHAKALPPKITY